MKERNESKLQTQSFILTLSISGEGGGESATLGTFLNNSKTPQNNETNFPTFKFYLRESFPYIDILIVLRCCLENVLFPVPMRIGLILLIFGWGGGGGGGIFGLVI